MPKLPGQNAIKYGAPRVEVLPLLLMLHYISRHSQINEPAIREHLGYSRATTHRMLRAARDQFGAIVTFRRDHTLPSGGEYTVEDWGVLDATGVGKFLRANRK